MENTLRYNKFRKIVTQIQVLAPMCQFEVAESLCCEEALYFRDRYSHLNSELDGLIGRVVTE